MPLVCAALVFQVLSVIAQQLLVLFGAKAQLVGYGSNMEIEFEDSRIVVEPTFNVFITMNPGYAGRTELPDNLKCLFRPMAMMVWKRARLREMRCSTSQLLNAQP